MERRTVLDQQKAHLLLLDYSHQLPNSLICSLADSLLRVLTINCSLPGPPRIPLFGIVCAGTTTTLSEDETLLSTQKTRGNFAAIHEALNWLKTKFVMLKGYEHIGCTDALYKSVYKSLLNYSTVVKKPGCDYDLELTVISSAVGYKVRKSVTKALQIANCYKCKTVTVVSVENGHRVSIDELDLSDDMRDFTDSEKTTSAAAASDNKGPAIDDLLNMTNIRQIIIDQPEHDLLSLKEFITSWLEDCNKDSHHLELSFPHPFNECDSLTLRFDLKEHILPVYTLPFYNKTSLDLSATFTKPASASIRSDARVSWQIPVYKLRVLQTVASPASLLSYIYGSPVMMEATECWKFDWEDLEENKSQITALHSHLLTHGSCLLCQLDIDGSCIDSNLQPYPFYCLSSITQHLVLQNLAYSELHMSSVTARSDNRTCEPEFSKLMDMEMALKKVKSESMVNTLSMESAGKPVDYLKCLTRSLLPKRLANRKRPTRYTAGSPKARKCSKDPSLDIDNRKPQACVVDSADPSNTERRTPFRLTNRGSRRRAELPLRRIKKNQNAVCEHVRPSMSPPSIPPAISESEPLHTTNSELIAVSSDGSDEDWEEDHHGHVIISGCGDWLTRDNCLPALDSQHEQTSTLRETRIPEATTSSRKLPMENSTVRQTRFKFMKVCSSLKDDTGTHSESDCSA